MLLTSFASQICLQNSLAPHQKAEKDLEAVDLEAVEEDKTFVQKEQNQQQKPSIRIRFAPPHHSVKVAGNSKDSKELSTYLHVPFAVVAAASTFATSSAGASGASGSSSALSGLNKTGYGIASAGIAIHAVPSEGSHERG